MQYIKKGEINNLVLNINNNARPNFATYSLVFTHVMSKLQKTYTIDTNNPLEYSSNIRYCTITIDLTGANDLIYEGQYQLNIFGDDEQQVYVTMVVTEGIPESNPFTEYVSPNEVNENHIYIQD